MTSSYVVYRRRRLHHFVCGWEPQLSIVNTNVVGLIFYLVCKLHLALLRFCACHAVEDLSASVPARFFLGYATSSIWAHSHLQKGPDMEPPCLLHYLT